MKYDIAVIGGGIQGAGIAQAAAAMGYSVIVFEQTAVAAATSSKSSKLIHGGLRYLESGQFKLVRKTLLERERLIKLAPDLVKPVKFYIPIYKDTKRRAWQIAIGLFIYKILGSFKKYTKFKKIKVSQQPINKLRKDNLQAVFQYYDAQTDDALLTQSVMRSAENLGAELHCPCEVININITKDNCEIKTNKDVFHSGFIINAAGPWVNHVLDRVSGTAVEKMQCDLVQGTHIIVSELAPEGIIYVEAPQDKRAVFIMPWKGKTLIGTTEKNYVGDPSEVVATESEVNYLSDVYQYYMNVTQINVVESFAGLRVLPKQQGSFFARPRDTIIHHSAENLLTLYGGKLTGYRVTAKEVLKKVNKIISCENFKPQSTDNIILR